MKTASGSQRFAAVILWMSAVVGCGSEPRKQTATPDGAPPDAAPPEPDAPPAEAGSTSPEMTPLPPGFVESVVVTGLTAPTAMRFSRDGRMFVAEKAGIIKEIDSDGRVTVVADLRDEVYDAGDRGLLSLALDPNFPLVPILYALYTLDGEVGDRSIPRYYDQCHDAANGECLAAGRLVRLTLSGTLAETNRSEVVLVENWGQQALSHSIGDVVFGPDGFLYVSGGDGASYDTTDFGNLGGNPLRDPPDPVGFSEEPPTAMGGSLRAQIVEPPAANPPFPTWFNGKVIRIDPGGPPLLDPRHVASSPVVASGLRNPFRLAFRPGTSELWLSDVGWNTWEELDVIPDVGARQITNFGWPCYEGPGRQPDFEALGLDVCSQLYGASRHTAPAFAYPHDREVVPADGCDISIGASITGVAFATGNAYPAPYRGALFFSDFSRQCIWMLPPDSTGTPDATRVRPFAIATGNAVDLQFGPHGDLHVVDHAGTIRRIEYAPE
jgi:glucose/arabinose dehydrogenase